MQCCVCSVRAFIGLAGWFGLPSLSDLFVHAEVTARTQTALTARLVPRMSLACVANEPVSVDQLCLALFRPYRRGSSIGGTVGYTLLICFAVFVVFAIVWHSEPARFEAKSPYEVVKAWMPEDRVSPNYSYNFKSK